MPLRWRYWSPAGQARALTIKQALYADGQEYLRGVQARYALALQRTAAVGGVSAKRAKVRGGGGGGAERQQGLEEFRGLRRSARTCPTCLSI